MRAYEHADHWYYGEYPAETQCSSGMDPAVSGVSLSLAMVESNGVLITISIATVHHPLRHICVFSQTPIGSRSLVDSL